MSEFVIAAGEVVVFGSCCGQVRCVVHQPYCKNDADFCRVEDQKARGNDNCRDGRSIYERRNITPLPPEKPKSKGEQIAEKMVRRSDWTKSWGFFDHNGNPPKDGWAYAALVHEGDALRIREVIAAAIDKSIAEERDARKAHSFNPSDAIARLRNSDSL
jgi:hypothetical protein